MNLRDIDYLVAEKVMGTPLYYHEYYMTGDGKLTKVGPFLNHQDSGESVCRRVPFYSTDIAEAWRVVEEVLENTNFENFSIRSATTDPLRTWSASFRAHSWSPKDWPPRWQCDSYGDFYATGVHGGVAVAICLAALKALEIDGPKTCVSAK